MTRGRWIVAAVALLLAAAVVGGGLFWRQHRVTEAATAKAATCRTIEQINDQRGAGPVGNGPVTVAVLGDSYAEGQQLTDPLGSWPTSFAAADNATVWVDAVGGSGFSQSTYCDGAEYPRRAATLMARHPAVVIVQGGLNDVTSDDAAIRRGVADTVGKLRGVTVVIVGPPLAPQRRASDVRRVDRNLAAAARLAGVRYVSTLGWPLTYGPDRLHPDKAGQALFGERVAAAVRRAG